MVAYVLVERGVPSLPSLDPAPLFRVGVEGNATDEQLLDAIEQAALFAGRSGAAVIYVRDLSRSSPEAKAAPNLPNGMGRPSRILVVEDDCLVAQDLTETIQELGGVVVGRAMNLAEALECARRTDADGAFVDLTLCDGFTGCAVAEAFNEQHNLPVVFITGRANQIPNGFPHALAVIEKPIAPHKVEMALALVELIQIGARASQVRP